MTMSADGPVDVYERNAIHPGIRDWIRVEPEHVALYRRSEQDFPSLAAPRPRAVTIAVCLSDVQYKGEPVLLKSTNNVSEVEAATRRTLEEETAVPTVKIPGFASLFPPTPSSGRKVARKFFPLASFSIAKSKSAPVQTPARPTMNFEGATRVGLDNRTPAEKGLIYRAVETSLTPATRWMPAVRTGDPEGSAWLTIDRSWQDDWGNSAGAMAYQLPKAEPNFGVPSGKRFDLMDARPAPLQECKLLLGGQSAKLEYIQQRHGMLALPDELCAGILMGLSEKQRRNLAATCQAYFHWTNKHVAVWDSQTSGCSGNDNKASWIAEPSAKRLIRIEPLNRISNTDTDIPSHMRLRRGICQGLLQQPTMVNHLRFSNVYWITPAVITALLPHLTSLGHLEIEDCASFGLFEVEDAIKACKRPDNPIRYPHKAVRLNYAPHRSWQCTLLPRSTSELWRPLQKTGLFFYCLDLLSTCHEYSQPSHTLFSKNRLFTEWLRTSSNSMTQEILYHHEGLYQGIVHHKWSGPVKSMLYTWTNPLKNGRPAMRESLDYFPVCYGHCWRDGKEIPHALFGAHIVEKNRIGADDDPICFACNFRMWHNRITRPSWEVPLEEPCHDLSEERQIRLLCSNMGQLSRGPVLELAEAPMGEGDALPEPHAKIYDLKDEAKCADVLWEGQARRFLAECKKKRWELPEELEDLRYSVPEKEARREWWLTRRDAEREARRKAWKGDFEVTRREVGWSAPPVK